MGVLQYFVINTAGAGTITVAAAVAGHKHKVLGMVLSANNNGTWTLQSGATLLTGQIRIFNNLQPMVIPVSSTPLCETPIGGALEFVGTGGAHDGVIVFVTEH